MWPLRVLLITNHSFLPWFCSTLLSKDWWWCSTVFPVYSLKHHNFWDFRQPSLEVLKLPVKGHQCGFRFFIFLATCYHFLIYNIFFYCLRKYCKGHSRYSVILLTKQAINNHSVFEALTSKQWTSRTEYSFLCMII